MPLQQRLELILEAVKYCQRARALGMPASCYTKALREPVHFLWERQRGTKSQAPAFRSKAAADLRFGARELVYDHAVPFRYLQEDLLQLSDPTAESVNAILSRSIGAVLITEEEDKRLSGAGYKESMPADWDRVDPLARYKAVGIELIENDDVGSSRHDA